jgi:hypothetical protein
MNWSAHYFRTIIIIGRGNASITELYEHIDAVKKRELMGLSYELIIKATEITSIQKMGRSCRTKTECVLCSLVGGLVGEKLKNNNNNINKNNHLKK